MSVSLAPQTIAHLYTTGSDQSYAWMPIDEPDDDRVVGYTVVVLRAVALDAQLVPTHIALTRRGHLVRHIGL